MHFDVSIPQNLLVTKKNHLMKKFSNILQPLALTATTVVASFSLLQSAPAQAATLLSDNFDANTLVFGLTGTLDSSFYVSTGDVDVIGPGLFDLYPGNGNYIDLNGYQLGGLTSNNSFTFTPGQSATLSFSYGSNNGSNSADVLLGGVIIDQLNSADLIGTNLNTVTLNIPNPQSGTLSFVSTTPSRGGIILDNVVLTSSATSVPEPFTIIGTLIGGTAAFKMRKKLKSQA